MTAQVTRQINDSITIEVTLPLTGSMLQAEEAIQDALNEVGLLATEKEVLQGISWLAQAGMTSSFPQ